MAVSFHIEGTYFLVLLEVIHWSRPRNECPFQKIPIRWPGNGLSPFWSRCERSRKQKRE